MNKWNCGKKSGIGPLQKIAYKKNPDFLFFIGKYSFLFGKQSRTPHSPKTLLSAPVL
jgi:hypothetical protein